jgi:DNA-binding transcriptional LysR family regulator
VLDVTRLRVLAAVSRYGSVTAAAQALGYAQPSVSHHLARLEAETGSRLVRRSGRGIVLTEAGRVLAERAEEILGRLAAAEAELAAYAGLAAGRVRLAAFPSALGTLVPVAVAGFAAAHPKVELRLAEAEPPDAIRMLREGSVDVALVFAYQDDAGAGDGLRRVPLLTDRTYLVTPPRLAGDTLAEHAGERWITGCERCREHLVRACVAAGFVPDIAFTTDDYVASQALVAAGLGVATLPGLALAASRHPAVRTVPLAGHDRLVSAAVLGAAPDPPPTATLLEHLAAAAGAWVAR